LLTKDAEVERFDGLIVEHHYLKSATLVGENLRYVATYRGEWLALMAFSAGSFNLRYREQFIGWTPEQRRRRLPLVVNNARLLVLPGCHYPNLSSRLIKLVLNRLSQDWQQRWGHPVALVETFVNPEFFRGTTYKVSGWSELGPTSGFGRCVQDFYEAHDQPKQLWVKELVKGACQKLRAATLPPEWAVVEQQTVPRCTAKGKDIQSLLSQLKELREFRSRDALSYPIAGVMALIVLAIFAGVVRGQRDLAAFARTLSQGQLRALGFRMNLKTRRIRSPKQTVFFRVLQAIDEDLLEQNLLRWQEKMLGPAIDGVIAIDGKVLRHARGVELVSSFGV
jgi:Druantia protein DruA